MKIESCTFLRVNILNRTATKQQRIDRTECVNKEHFLLKTIVNKYTPIENGIKWMELWE